MLITLTISSSFGKSLGFFSSCLPPQSVTFSERDVGFTAAERCASETRPVLRGSPLKRKNRAFRPGSYPHYRSMPLVRTHRLGTWRSTLAGRRLSAIDHGVAVAVLMERFDFANGRCRTNSPARAWLLRLVVRLSSCRACGAVQDPFPWQAANGLPHRPEQPSDSRRAGPTSRDILPASCCSGSSDGASAT